MRRFVGEEGSGIQAFNQDNTMSLAHGLPTPAIPRGTDFFAQFCIGKFGMRSFQHAWCAMVCLSGSLQVLSGAAPMVEIHVHVIRFSVLKFDELYDWRSRF